MADTTRSIPTERGTCRSCGAPIYWVVMFPSGKRMPIDVKPVAGLLTVEIGEPDTGHVWNADEPLYRSHFSSCPNAAQHRKPRRPAP
jgi:hypothetical protein